MTKEEALTQTLQYASDNDWSIENMDLSDETFAEAMVQVGLIYKTKDGSYRKRGQNGIFSHGQNGQAFKGMSDYDREMFQNIGFSAEIQCGSEKVTIQKAEGDPAATVVDENNQLLGWVSPARDTRAHWMVIPGDNRPFMMSFTTQYPNDTKLLDGVWVKGQSIRDPKRVDFFHGEISQRIMASRVVELCNGKVYEQTRSQFREMDFNAMRNWNAAAIDVSITIDGDVKVELKKNGGDKIAKVIYNGTEIGEAFERVNVLFKHYTSVRWYHETAGEILSGIHQRNMKIIIDWIYSTMVDPHCGAKQLKKTNKKLQKEASGRVVKDFASL